MPTSTRCWPARCAGSSSPAPTPTSPPCSCACCAATGSTSSWPTSRRPPVGGGAPLGAAARRRGRRAGPRGRRAAGAAGARRRGWRAGRPGGDPRHGRVGARRGVLRRAARAARVGRRLVVTPGRTPAPSPGGIAEPAPPACAVARRAAGAPSPTAVHDPVPPAARAGRGAAVGRAVQVGCLPATVVHDGVAHPRPVTRWAWYRHVADWLLVRTMTAGIPSFADRSSRRRITLPKRPVSGTLRRSGRQPVSGNRPVTQHARVRNTRFLAFTRTGRRRPAAPHSALHGTEAPGDPSAPRTLSSEPEGTWRDHTAHAKNGRHGRVPVPGPRAHGLRVEGRPGGHAAGPPRPRRRASTPPATRQDRLPQLALRHDGDQREDRPRLADDGRPTRSTPPAACSASRSQSVGEDGASTEPTVFAEKTEKLITAGLGRRGVRRLDLVVAARRCCRSSRGNNGAAVLPGAVRGPGGVAEHLLHRRDDQPADRPGDGLPQGRRASKTLFLVGSDYVFPRTANKIIKAYAAANGIEIVGEEYAPLGYTDFSTIVNKVKSADADAVFNTLNGDSQRRLLQGVQERRA